MLEESEALAPSAARDIPSYSANLFAAAALKDPFDHYKTIRDLGPVVKLVTPEVLVLGRFVDVRDALRAPEALISGQGIGFNAIVNTPREHPSTINSDGERHRRLRGGLNTFLMPKSLKEYRAMFRDLIDERIAFLASRGEWFDAMADIAQHLPLEAVSKLVGLPAEARGKMLQWATATFNSFGIPGDDEASRQRFAADIAVRSDIQRFLRAVEPTEVKPGSWGERLFRAVDSGRMDIDEARSALSALVLPSLDTTIYAKGNLLYNLAQSPGEWSKLRADPTLVTAAVMEGMRHRPVVRWFSRVAKTDYLTDNVHIPAGARVMLLYGAANRDDRHYRDPDRFDIARAPMDHLGWGTGPHMCAGMHLARMEMEVLLEAMIERVATIEVGEPVLGTNQGLFGFDSLPMRLR